MSLRGSLPRVFHLLEHLLLLLAILLHLGVVRLIHLLLVEGSGCIVGSTYEDLLSQKLILILHLLLLVGGHIHRVAHHLLLLLLLLLLLWLLPGRGLLGLSKLFLDGFHWQKRNTLVLGLDVALHEGLRVHTWR